MLSVADDCVSARCFPGRLRSDKEERALLLEEGTAQLWSICPGRWRLIDHDKIDIIAQELHTFSTGDERIAAINANPLLALADGAPNPAFFRPDGSGLNEAGYVRLGLLLDDALEEG